MELEDTLDKETCLVAEPERGRATLHNLLETGGDDKRWFSQGGIILGWAVPAAFRQLYVVVQEKVPLRSFGCPARAR